MTQVQRDMIALPATGLMIYNTTANTFQYNVGTPQVPIWVSMLYINIDGGSSSGVFWSLLGNDSVDASKNFLGTHQDQPLIIKTDSITRAIFTGTGELNIYAPTFISGSLDLTGDTTSLLMNANPGALGSPLVSQGPGRTPQWSLALNITDTLINVSAPTQFTGETRFIDTATFDLLPIFPLQYGHFLIGDSTDRAVPMPPGLEGSLMQIQFGQPVWVTPDQANYWSLAGNAGIGATDFIGTTDANDLRIATNATLRATFTSIGVFDVLVPTQVTGSLSLQGTGSPLVLNGSSGASGQVLISQGAGVTPRYTDTLTLSSLTVTGQSLFIDTARFQLLPVFPLNSQNILVGDSTNIAKPLVPGSDSTFLAIMNGQVVWFDLGLLLRNTAWIVGGNSGVSSPILGNKDTTGIRDVDIWAGGRSIIFTDGTQYSIDLRGPVNLDGPNISLSADGNAGTPNQLLVSQGPGITPTWSDSLTLSHLTVTGESQFIDTATFNLLPKFPLQHGFILVGDSNNIAQPFAPGLEGSLMQIQFGLPTWVTQDQAAYWSLSGNGGVPPTSFLGTTDANDLRIATNATLRATFTAGGVFDVLVPTQVTGSLSLMGTTSPLVLNGDAGNANYVLMSQGAGNTPVWFDLTPLINLNPWLVGGNDSVSSAILGNNNSTGAIRDVDLRAGGQTMVLFDGTSYTTRQQTPFNLDGTAIPLLANGDAGTTNQVLQSMGPGQTPNWTDSLTLATLTVTGESHFIDTATFDLLPKFPLQHGYIIVGDSNNLGRPFAPGLEGSVMQIEFGQPTWVTPDQSAYWSLSGNGGIPPTAFLGTTDANDLRIATNATLRATFTSTGVFDIAVPTQITGLLSLQGASTPLQLNGDAGNLNFVLMSQGAGNTPLWYDITPLLTMNPWLVGGNDSVSSAILGNNNAAAGIRDVDLRAGGQTMVLYDGTTYTTRQQTPFNLDGANVPLLANGNAGAINQVLVSSGPGTTPTWSDSLTLSHLTVTGESHFIDTATFDLFPKMPLQHGYIIVGDSTNRAVPYAPGLEGSILQVEFGTPKWVTPDQSAYWSLSGNGGIAPTAFLGTTDANDLRLATNGTLRATLTAGGVFDIVSPTQITGSLSLQGPSSPLVLNGDAGNNNFVLMSQGAGNTPVWFDITSLLGDTDWKVGGNDSVTSAILGNLDAVGAIRNVDLRAGGQTMVLYDGTAYKTLQKTTLNFDGNAIPFEMNGDAGTTNQVLQSMGPGNTPNWTDSLTLATLTVTGESHFIDTATFDLFPKMPLQHGYIIVGDSTNRAVPFAPGLEGSVLQIEFGTPTWVTADQSSYWSLTGNTGIGPANFLGTNDANDLRLATSATVRLTIGAATGDVTIANLSGAPTLTPLGANDGIVVADNTGTLTKRDKSLFLSELGVARGRYTNGGATPEYSVVITTPVGFVLDAVAAIVITPEATSSVSITPFIINGSRTANSFTISFPGGLNPGESINWMVLNP